TEAGPSEIDVGVRAAGGKLERARAGTARRCGRCRRRRRAGGRLVAELAEHVLHERVDLVLERGLVAGDRARRHLRLRLDEARLAGIGDRAAGHAVVPARCLVDAPLERGAVTRFDRLLVTLQDVCGLLEDALVLRRLAG